MTGRESTSFASFVSTIALASVTARCAAAPVDVPPRDLGSIASAAPSPPSEPAPAASSPASAEPAAPTVVSPSPVSYLEGAPQLDALFQALAGLEDGPSREAVRVLQYGDSHTAGDLGVSVVRRTLQARFGDGGRGFVPLGRPWKGYWQGGLHVGMSKEFYSARFRPDAGATLANGAFGLLGVGIETAAANAIAWTEVAASFSHVEIAFLRQPRGGSFDVLVDDVETARVASRTPAAGSEFVGLDVAEGPHKITIRAAGDGPVRVFGMTLDRATPAGVVVDALGIVGAQISTPLRWQEAHFAEQVAHRSPRLVIFAYGTNEAVEPRLTDAAYERSSKELLGRVARAAPGASCLLLGPPDLARKNEVTGEWTTVPRLLEIVAMQRRIAAEAGCAFYDQLAAMGGAGSVAVWAAEPEPRARKDRVHLTARGYAQIATSFAADLLHAYDQWRAARASSPAVAARP